MSDAMSDFEVPVFRSDLRVTADEDGDVEIHGASDDAVALLMAIQQDDLRAVREMYAKDLDLETPQMRGRRPMGEEIANRVAQITRRAVEAGMVTYSPKDEMWILNELKVRNALFRGDF